MNWLAHLFLSGPHPASRIGGLLPDLIKPAELTSLPSEFQRGIGLHKQIDAFTDAHPVFRSSIRRFDPGLRRYGGILVDLFYDHFLTRHWNAFSEAGLDEFLAAVYSSFETYRTVLPPLAWSRMNQMRNENWLSSYHQLEGLGLALDRIAKRFRRPVDLSPAILALERDYGNFEQDFREFFPELVTFVGAK